MQRIISWMISKPIRTIGVIILVFVAALLIRNATPETATMETEVKLPSVSLTTPAEFAGTKNISLIGTVRSTSEAEIAAERPGRVTGVNVRLGQTVSAGTVVATLENASERAAVLQAEGAYDAAVAAATQSSLGNGEAQTSLNAAKRSAVSTVKSAYNTANGMVVTSIDQFFADSERSTPGLRIDGRGYTDILNAERVAYQTLLPEWEQQASSVTAEDDLITELQYAKANVERTTAFIDTFITVFEIQNNSSRYSDAELQGFISSFTNLRATLIGVVSSIDGSVAQLEAAADAVERASISASGGTASAADAQVKQALGSLRAAQASFAKTILRTPVAGAVNKLDVTVGDYVGSFEVIAMVTNEGGKEVVTFVSESDREFFTVGTEVLIEDIATGRVSEVSPTVDSATGKIEVRIAADSAELVSGDAVRVSRSVVMEEVVDGQIMIPLSAVKFEAENGFVLTVIDGVLTEQPVTLGVIRGGSVEISEGLATDTQFVRDARGLQVGSEVIINK